MHYRLLGVFVFYAQLACTVNCPSWVLFNCKMKIVFVTII